MQTVRLKFKHDNLHPLGNHYQSIIEKSKSSKKSTFKKPIVKKEHPGYGTKSTPDVPYQSIIEKSKSSKKSTFKKPIVKKEHPGYGTKSTPDVIDLTQDDTPVLSQRNIFQRTASGGSSSEPWSDKTYISSDCSSEYSSGNIPPTPKYAEILPAFPYSNTEDISTEASSPEFVSTEDGISDTNTEVKVQSLAERVSRERPFPTWFFDDKQPEHVNAVPDHIDGPCYYKVDVQNVKWHSVTSDKRHFKMMSSSQEGFIGER